MDKTFYLTRYPTDMMIFALKLIENIRFLYDKFIKYG